MKGKGTYSALGGRVRPGNGSDERDSALPADIGINQA